MRCPVCGLDHGRYIPARTVTLTKAGYLLLATWRAEENARKHNAGDSHGDPAQVPAPPSDVTRAVWGEGTSADAAAVAGPIGRGGR
jgi:hypothetical protein